MPKRIKVTLKPICIKCNKLRIITYLAKDKKDKEEFLIEIKNEINNYVCSDCVWNSLTARRIQAISLSYDQQQQMHLGNRQ